jgi:membrane protein DedA with SNARE-associated domain/membrane-associated phospholipid phosphatase
MEHFLHPLILWLHANPTWAGIITFSVTLFESLAIIGLLVPGSVTLSAIGGLVGSGVVPAVDIFAWAIAGAIIGDGVSYWIGYRYHKTIKTIWPFNRFPKLFEKGEAFFLKHGGKGIFFGRFVGPIRPVMPLIAGIMRVSPRKFILVDVISGILWAPAYMVPGILVGAAAAHFAPAQAFHLLFIALLIIIGVWLVIWLTKFLSLLFLSRWRRLCKLAWNPLMQKNTTLYRLICEHFDTASARPMRLFITTVLFTALFLFVILASTLQLQWMVSLNQAVLALFQSLYFPTLETVAIAISTFLGEHTVILVSCAVTTLYLAARRDWHSLFHFVFIYAGSAALIEALKHVSHHMRPDVVLQAPATFSFPSGHTLLALTVFGFIAFLLSQNKPLWLKKLYYSIVIVIVTLVALSRLYLNVHWLSDIVGSLLLGTILLCITIISYRRYNVTAKFKPSFILIIFIITQITMGTLFFHKHHQILQRHYTLQTVLRHLPEDSWWQEQRSLVPVYRFNRFNKPAQVLNLQWLGDPKNIARTLKKSGWNDGTRLSYHSIKRKLFGDKTILLPPIPEQIRDQTPSLVMVKHVNNEAYLLLQLWDDHYQVNNKTLYLGSISYHLPMKYWLWDKKQNCKVKYPAVLKQLSSLNKTWQTNVIDFKAQYSLKQQACVKNENKILLLR